jgi:hypothetical protein
VNDPAALGEQMHRLVERLNPLCRSITGDGVRAGLPASAGASKPSHRQAWEQCCHALNASRAGLAAAPTSWRMRSPSPFCDPQLKRSVVAEVVTAPRFDSELAEDLSEFQVVSCNNRCGSCTWDNDEACAHEDGLICSCGNWCIARCGADVAAVPTVGCATTIHTDYRGAWS